MKKRPDRTVEVVGAGEDSVVDMEDLVDLVGDMGDMAVAGMEGYK